MINRVLQVRMVKPKKDEPTDADAAITAEDIFLSRLYNVELVVQSMMFNVGVGVGSYILLDTFRRSVIAMASK